MARVMVAVAALAAGCLVTPVMHFGGGKTRKQVEHETVQEMTPPALAPEGAWHGPVRTATIRVYADDDYRGQNARWEQTFQQVLADANQVLSADYGVQLVPDFRTWDRHAPGEELSDGLAALATRDGGDDVFAVVGLTSSTPLTTGAFEQVGYAEVGGRHLIVRGYADVEERAAFERSFESIDEDDKEAMFAARRRHRNATLFLHELGHTLGAPHSPDTGTIMSAVYSTNATSYDPASRALILKALDARLNPTAEPAPAATAPAADPQLPPPEQLERTATDGHTVLSIGVDRHGNRIVGGNAVDAATLDQLLALTAKDDPTTEIEIRAMPGATAGAVQQVREQVQKAGLTRVRTVILR